MRSAIVAALAAVCSLVLTACGAAQPSPAPATTGDRFPVTISHAYGETTVPARPQRIVALGYNDIAIADAVGAPIVGALRNYSPDGTGDPNLPYLRTPLSEEVLGIEEEPTGGVNVEKVASYRPDLILAVSSALVLDRATYERLSGIAPVVVYEHSLYGSPMQDDARRIGLAIGASEEVEALIAEADTAVAALRAELPALAGRTYLFGQARGDILPMVVGEQNLSTVFMRSLGLDVPENFRNAPATNALAPGTVGVSYEQVGMLDSADALFMTFAAGDDRARFEGNPLVRQLRPVREGNYLPLSLDQAIALQAPNVVAVRWLLDQLRPALQKVASPQG
ncbi:iron complex transport system substrate-binding protein [Pseudonocardia hierapolitana]|uniref:Iron complex transport system substrate-binding protein n=1 Tax=Pseudonocardia hierapolitana TaxID=1128676 RepID=A0A561SHG7_9PSEU|nr:ABC transporter substrate-binding protein [Pseudonocardia hierapolitana]TWF74302.1 iron complex transport system substrate-binding protein [Pseudonocardia hierapolitana]